MLAHRPNICGSRRPLREWKCTQSPDESLEEEVGTAGGRCRPECKACKGHDSTDLPHSGRRNEMSKSAGSELCR